MKNLDILKEEMTLGFTTHNQGITKVHIQSLAYSATRF